MLPPGPQPDPLPQPPPPGTVVITIPPPVISVWVKREDTGELLPVLLPSPVTATLNATSGTWTIPKPGGLVAGKCYTIIATLSHPDFMSANDKKNHITT
jgi:hypothetical protein